MQIRQYWLHSMANNSEKNFFDIKIQAGTIVKAEPFSEAKKPAIKLWIDFGPDCIKTSSAQITDFYKPEKLINTQVICVTSLPSMRIAGFKSEVLVTGFAHEEGGIILARPEVSVPNGSKLH